MSDAVTKVNVKKQSGLSDRVVAIRSARVPPRPSGIGVPRIPFVGHRSAGVCRGL